MKHENFVWVTLAQLICFKEFCLSTHRIPTEGIEATTTNITFIPLNASTVTVNVEKKELLEIFHGGLNITKATTNHPEVVTGENIDNITTAGDHSSNVTLKTNYTVVSEAIALEEDSVFRLESTGVIAAGVFLISAVIGYFSCVGYRRFMQKKYGNSQILVGEDVYDTRDLRYFEI